MSIHKYRSDIGRPFGRLDMMTIRDPNLSNAEIGLLLRLLSLPETWSYTDRGICKVYPQDGRTALRSQLKALETKGYVKRVRRLKDNQGRYTGSELIITEVLPNCT